MTAARTTSTGRSARARRRPSQGERSDEAFLETAARLRLSATRLARQLRQQSSTGLTPSLLSGLASIDRHGPLTLGALADCERVTAPTITKVVRRLEEDGLVERETDADDRRVVRVRVTEAGADLLDRTRRRRDAWLSVRLRDLDDEQRARLDAALDVLERLTTGDE